MAEVAVREKNTEEELEKPKVYTSPYTGGKYIVSREAVKTTRFKRQAAQVKRFFSQQTRQRQAAAK